ncbi:MAG: FimV/HubP family polar landmark protein, partial [Dokdonella sp.]
LGFNLGRDDFPATPVAHAHPATNDDDSFDFTLPPLDMDPPVVHAPPAAVAAPKMAELDDDYFAGDDAIGTKLDLAKAYMDMGDPDGARSMLEEVVAEGSEAQKAEAHRLISEIR